VRRAIDHMSTVDISTDIDPAVAAARRQRRASAQMRRLFLWLAQAFPGAIAGFALGNGIVETKCTLLEPHSRGTMASVEVRILGVLVSKENGIAHLFEDEQVDGSTIRYVSARQAVWVYAPPLLGAVVGVCAAVIIATSLCRSTTKSRRGFARLVNE
jgi:hypothetical protein